MQLPAALLFALVALSPRSFSQSVPNSQIPRAVFAPTAQGFGANVFRAFDLGNGPELISASTIPGATAFGYRWQGAGSSLRSKFVVQERPTRFPRAIDVGDVAGDLVPEIVLGWTDGLVQVIDSATRAVVLSFTIPNPSSGVLDLAVRDMNGDGISEIVTFGREIAILDALGTPVLRILVNSPGGLERMALGQLDTDPAVEIALGAGPVFDGSTGALQFSVPFQAQRAGLALLDTDGDGLDEYIEVVGRTLTAWNAEVPAIAATRDFANDIGDIAFMDLGADGSTEILVADSGNLRIRAVRPSDFQLLQTLQVSGATGVTGFSRLETIDFDGDGDVEILAGSLLSSTPRILVIDPATGLVTASSAAGGQGFVGPLIGDVDGDGVVEVVIASRASSTINASRIFLLTADELNVKLASAPGLGLLSGGRDLRLSDVDGDGSPEVVLTGSTSARMEVWDVAANGELQVSFTVVPSLPPGESASWSSGTVQDIDGDGQLEAVGAGTKVAAYSVGPNTQEWSYTPTGAPQYLDDMEIGDFDGDGLLEVAALCRQTGVIHLLDATNGALQQEFPAQAAALNLLSPPAAGGFPRLLAGGLSGEGLVIAGAVSGLSTVAQGSLGAGLIERVDSQGRAILTVRGGVIGLHRGFSAPAWTTTAINFAYNADARFAPGTGNFFLVADYNGVRAY